MVGGIAGVVGGALGLGRGIARASRCACGTDWSSLFLFFWTIGIVTELQRSEMLDLSRLLHLPVSLRDVFLLNYLASHFSLSLAMMLPAMLGLTVGLVLGTRRGDGAAVAAGVRVLLHDHGLDVLPARLAGGADGQQAPPPGDHHGRHDGVRAAGPVAQSGDERLDSPAGHDMSARKRAEEFKRGRARQAEESAKRPPSSSRRTATSPFCGCRWGRRLWRKAARGRRCWAPSA